MKTKNAKSKLIAITLAIMLTVGLSNLSIAQQGRGNGDGTGSGPKFNMQQKGNAAHCMNLPDLTEEQQKQIKELRIKHLKAMLPLKNEIREKQAHLKTLTTKEKVDVNAVNSTIDEIVKLKGKMMKSANAHKQEIRKILTEEQRVIFDSRPQMRKHGNKHGSGCGYGQGMGRGHGKGYHNNYRGNRTR